MATRFTRAMSTQERRRRRVRTRVRGTNERPRLSVFRSAKHLVAQIIDDGVGRTLVTASDGDVHTAPVAGVARNVTIARGVGSMIAERARARGITKVVFDRGGYAYHGRVQAVADGAREGGLEF